MRALLLRLRDQRGFSLVEILIVMILLGILAAIVLPALLGNAGKGDDASAKSDVSEVARAVEHCSAGVNDYSACDEPTEIDVAGFPWGNGAGEVRVVSAAEREYEVHGTSKGGHGFTWTRRANGTIDRTCAPVGKGGCASDGTW